MHVMPGRRCRRGACPGLAGVAAADHVAVLRIGRPARYQLRQSLIAVGSGGAFGKGFGSGFQQDLFLPYPYSDFIGSVVGARIASEIDEGDRACMGQSLELAASKTEDTQAREWLMGRVAQPTGSFT